MRVLVACEYSGLVREAFNAKGHDAWSCDLLPTDIPSEKHIQGDCIPVLTQGWDLIIAHPPCTYLSYAATQYWNRPGRAELRKQALDFFLRCYNAPCGRVAVENPVGYQNTVFRKPDQIFHPYHFGDAFKKRTCLWLRGLPKLIYLPDAKEPPPIAFYKTGKSKGKPIHWCEYAKGFDGGHERSKTFPGVAKAMAEQWG